VNIADRKYWLQLFTIPTWNRFVETGAKVAGFRENMRHSVNRIAPGDYLLAYLTGVSRFIALLEATSQPFVDRTPIWPEAVFPERVSVRIIASLTPETAISVHDLSHRLSMFRNTTSASGWTGSFRQSPSRWSESDAGVVIKAITAPVPKSLAKYG
jgi:hypothetical protein